MRNCNLVYFFWWVIFTVNAQSADYVLPDIMTEKNYDRNIHVFSDIAKKKKKRNGCLSERVSLSITILYCYSHILACQVLYSPKWTESMGLMGGERLERVWSYLGKFTKIMKEMTPENRTDILEKGLHHYAK